MTWPETHSLVLYEREEQNTIHVPEIRSADSRTSDAQYRFVLYDFSTSAWTVLREYSTTAEAAWTPTRAGTYTLQVWARRAGSSALFDAWAGTGAFVVTAAGSSVSR
jgi:hypothetical protein